MSPLKRFWVLVISLLSLISFGCTHDSSPESKPAPAKSKKLEINLSAIDSRLNEFKNKLAELQQCLATKGIDRCDTIAAQLNSL